MTPFKTKNGWLLLRTRRYPLWKWTQKFGSKFESFVFLFLVDLGIIWRIWKQFIIFSKNCKTVKTSSASDMPRNKLHSHTQFSANFYDICIKKRKRTTFHEFKQFWWIFYISYVLCLCQFLVNLKWISEKNTSENLLVLVSDSTKVQIQKFKTLSLKFWVHFQKAPSPRTYKPKEERWYVPFT